MKRKWYNIIFKMDIDMEIIRHWCMPNSNTFEMSPIKKYLSDIITSEKIVIDPFARNSEYAPEWSNDLNPETTANYHMDAIDFCDMLVARKIKADVVLFDPPYSPRQISECYQNIGRKVTAQDTQNARLYKEVKDRLSIVLKPGGMSICFGWNSSGFGKNRGFDLKKILLLAHGGAHNDTIVTFEKKKFSHFTS